MRPELRHQRNELEDILNWVSDQDHQWWPFLFLRPEQNQRMSALRVLAVSCLLGTFAGMLANVAIALTAARATERLSVLALPPWLTLPLASSALFFLFFRYTFASSWNRRAERLRVGRTDD